MEAAMVYAVYVGSTGLTLYVVMLGLATLLSSAVDQ